MWLAANFRGSGAEKGSSAVVVGVVDETELRGLAMIRQLEARETQQLNSSFMPRPRLNTQTDAGILYMPGSELSEPQCGE